MYMGSEKPSLGDSIKVHFTLLYNIMFNFRTKAM